MLTEMTTTKKFHYTDVETAMSVLCCMFASDIGQPFTGVDGEDRYGTVGDIAAAISQPASVASVLNDLCDLMGIDPPRYVAYALGGEDAPVHCSRCGTSLPVKALIGRRCVACWRAIGVKVDEPDMAGGW